MKIGMIGLGKMGGNMTTRLLEKGHELVVYDPDKKAIQEAVKAGAAAAEDLEHLVEQLEHPRAIWVMVPAGDPVESVIADLERLLESGDTIIDGGNSNYKESESRAARLARKGIYLVDVGTSGGIWGLTEGYSMMVGGVDQAVNRLTPIFQSLAPAEEQGWGHVGPSGAGHFAKMIHNGIEYGMMQAYAEGFDVLRAKETYDLDLHQIAEIWRYGSVIRSWLLDLIAEALTEGEDLGGIRGWVADSGEGRWAVAEAIALDVPAPVMTLALLMRFVSRQDESYAAKMLAAMRQQFGGHAVQRD